MMIKNLIIDTLKGTIRGTLYMIIVFLVLAIIFLVIQPLFPPIVTIILGFAVVICTYIRFLKISSRVFNGILDAGKTNKGFNYKMHTKANGRGHGVDKSSQAYIYLETKEADELNRKGCLDKAIDKYKSVLKKLSISDSPNEYAHINFNLGVAYTKLSEERDKEENTFKAILAYEESLKVYSIEKSPIDFAIAQCELGYSYGKLSGPDDKEAYALIAISCYDKALKVYTADKYPLFYAAINNNVGNLYGRLITSMDQRDYYHKAFTAYNEALKFITEDINPQAFKLVKENFAYTNLRFVSPNSDTDFYDFRIVRDLDKIIMSDYRRDEYLSKLRPVAKKNFYHLNDEELHKLCITLTDISKALEDYLYSPAEIVDALYSYMEYERLNLGNVFEDVNKVLEYFRTTYKWTTPEGQSYREKLKPIVEEQYGYLKSYEQSQLCKTLSEVAKLWDNYGHSPEEMVSAINGYIVFARIDIRSVIGDVFNTLQYFREMYK